MPQQVVIKDSEFLKMITRGHTSAYTIFTAMKKQAEVDEKERVITYKNIGERILRLARDGLIEVTETDERSIHGRKDYQLTLNGIMNLMSSPLNKEDVKMIIDYLSKISAGNESFSQGFVGTLLLTKLNDVNILLDEYAEHINIPELMRLKRALMKYSKSSEF